MARHLNVYPSQAVVAAPVPGGWKVQEDAISLYDQPFGSEGAVREWWSAPAAGLGLPLLASIYEYGFNNGIRWSNGELDQLLPELNRLEQHWREAGLSNEELERRFERSIYLREAINIAKTKSGVIVII